MWIKICGITSPEAVRAALDAGADALGFVFAPSVRRVTPQVALQLAVPARGRAICVAVLQHPARALVDEIVNVFRPDVLQTDIDDLDALNLRADDACVLPVVRTGRALPEILPPRLLLEGLRSGSGVPADWDAAASLARGRDLVLAGGLDAANVGAALARVAAFGVDVSTGVESAPGIKSPQRIREFVETVRAHSSTPQAV